MKRELWIFLQNFKMLFFYFKIVQILIFCDIVSSEIQITKEHIGK